MLKGRIKSRIFSIVISCWGFILFGAFLTAEILEAGSFNVFLQRFTQPSLIFFHSLLFLSVPGFIVMGYFYQKLANAHERLEQMVDESVRAFRESERIRMAEEKFRNIFESANDALIYLNRSGRILDVNQKTVEVFGGSREELLGKHFTRVGIFSLKDIPTLMRNFANIFEGKRVSIDLTFKNKKSQEKSLECSASLIKKAEKPLT
jgi:PAS domain S-box-containing protein